MDKKIFNIIVISAHAYADPHKLQAHAKIKKGKMKEGNTIEDSERRVYEIKMRNGEVYRERPTRGEKKSQTQRLRVLGEREVVCRFEKFRLLLRHVAKNHEQ